MVYVPECAKESDDDRERGGGAHAEADIDGRKDVLYDSVISLGSSGK